jgi:hypothetical protein
VEGREGKKDRVLEGWGCSKRLWRVSGQLKAVL